jgi:hypothetical protein
MGDYCEKCNRKLCNYDGNQLDAQGRCIDCSPTLRFEQELLELRERLEALEEQITETAD